MSKNGFLMGRFFGVAGFGGLLAVVFFAGGCSETLVYKQNKELREQNRELQARLDERTSMTRTETLPMTPPPAPQPTIQQQPEPAANVISPVREKPAVSIGGPAAEAPLDLGSSDVSFDKLTGTTTVNFVGDALFDSGKATLKDSAKKSLDKTASALKKNFNGKTVKVNGYSDSDPIRHSKWKSNQELSEARAKAVRDYLVQRGVTAGQVSFTGFGEAQPKSTTDKAKNRRVEIVVASR